MRVLIVEDDSVTAEMLAHALERYGYEVEIARNGRQAFQRIRSGQHRLVVSDWEMPEMTGVELCRQIRGRRSGSYVYVILLTSRRGTRNVVEGLNAGADDFITKPFEPQELCCRLRVGERILSLETRDLTIFAMAKLAESRDPETGAHLERIREYCRILAEHLSRQVAFRDLVDDEYIQTLYLTSPLHDIGKVGIPDRVLLKPGPLTDDEFEVMKQHTVIGGRTLEAVRGAHSGATFLQMATDIAWSHHERFDGTGYPRGRAGEQIPLSARIVAVADVYDALTTKRVYKPAFEHSRARSLIFEGKGTQFDPAVVEAFCATDSRIVAVRQRFADWPACGEPAWPAPALLGGQLASLTASADGSNPA
jgi:putative two-component system response regulator